MIEVLEAVNSVLLVVAVVLFGILMAIEWARGGDEDGDDEQND